MRLSHRATFEPTSSIIEISIKRVIRIRIDLTALFGIVSSDLASLWRRLGEKAKLWLSFLREIMIRACVSPSGAPMQSCPSLLWQAGERAACLTRWINNMGEDSFPKKKKKLDLSLLSHLCLLTSRLSERSPAAAGIACPICVKCNNLFVCLSVF